MQIGAQLFTLRDFCQSLDAFEETLKRVAAIGYTTVQVSGTCEYTPAWLAEKLRENGLKCVLTHIPADRLQADPAAVAADHTVFGCDHIGLGWYDFEHNIPADFITEYEPVAKALAAYGKQFMFHNHYLEFKRDGDRFYLERLAEHFSPEQLGFTLDTHWVHYAGEDPAAWLEKLSGRVPCIHLKDITEDKKMAVVGEGLIDFDRVFEKAEAAGTAYMLVEQDDCYGEDPFACLERSYHYLKAKGF